MGLVLDEPKKDEAIYSTDEFDVLADSQMMGQLESVGGATIDMGFGQLRIVTGTGC